MVRRYPSSKVRSNGCTEWVDREKIELQPNDISLTNEMMKVFKYKQ